MANKANVTVDVEAIYYLGMKKWCSRREAGRPEGRGDLLAAVSRLPWDASVWLVCPDL